MPVVPRPNTPEPVPTPHTTPNTTPHTHLETTHEEGMGEKESAVSCPSWSKEADLRPAAYSAQGFESLTHHRVVVFS